MKAAILQNQGVMTYEEVPTPEPGPGELRLKVKAVSICGSDIKRYVSGHRMYPIILGHECAGVIDRVGAGVDESVIGQHAAVIPVVPCFECEQCQQGHYSACHSYSFIGSRQAGGFADYVILPRRNALIVPDEVPFEHAALIEPSSVARHMLALGEFRAGQTAVVLGVGSIGLLLVQWLRILGAKLTICVDVEDSSLEVASTFGAQVGLNPARVNVVDEVRRLPGDGVDLALEMAGVPQTLELTVPLTRPRGRVVLGGNQPLDQSLPLTFIENMMRRELTMTGCFMSYSAPFPGHEWTDSVEALQRGSLDLDAMISHRFPLSASADVFARLGAHTLAHRKIMLNPEAQRIS